MHTVLANLRYALRQLRRSPGFTFTVVLTLALGVGANVVVFSVLNAVILRPLALPNAEQLQFFNRMYTSGGGQHPSPSESWPDYRDIRDRNHSFSGVTAYRLAPVGVRYGEVVAKSWIYEASGNYFDTLGVQPALGRFFHASDEHGINGSPYVVLSNSYWRGHFQADASIVGKTIEINKHPFTVLGVAPATFAGTELFLAPDMWTPILNAQQLEPWTSFEERGSHGIWWIGRLKPGITVAQAQADVNAIATQLAHQYKEDESLHFTLSKPGLIGEMLGGPVRAFLLGVMALAGLVLVAACANLGSLFAARSADRARELALRLALGASRAILIGQLLTESLVVSLLGGATGVVTALGLLHALNHLKPFPDFPNVLTIHADARVFLFALVLSVASGVFFGLVPLRSISRADAYLIIKSGPSAATGTGARRLTLRDLLLVTQIVLCSVLVTASLVAVRGLSRSLHTSYGFQPQGALLAHFDLKMAGQSDDSAVPLQHRALDAVAALPGVAAVGFANTLPLSVDSSDSGVYRDGATDLRPSNAVADANYYDVSPGYVGAAGTRILAGRDFSWHDDAHAPRVALVNQTFARTVFEVKEPNSAVGRYFQRGATRIEVVGILEDGKYTTLTEDPKSAMFFPINQETNAQTVMVVRGHGTIDAGLPDEVRRTLRSLSPGLPVEIDSWTESMSMALFPSMAATASLGVMGGLAAMLAITGIFGMASYSVSKRLRELGLRIALGAQRGQVLKAALGRPARLLLVGSIAGLALGAAASQLLAHIVYQASPQDPLVLAGVVAAMVLIALVACWLPARRALSIDPATLLREE